MLKSILKDIDEIAGTIKAANETDGTKRENTNPRIYSGA
jgi:hypothetical protein